MPPNTRRYLYAQKHRGAHVGAAIPNGPNSKQNIMSLKTQILTQLKEHVKAKGINLSNVRINAFADKLDAYVDSEDAIKAEIEKLDALIDFKELASLDDAKRTAEKKAAEEADKGKGNDPADPAKTDPANPPKSDKDDAPAWFKQHVEQQNKVIETLTSKLTAFEAGQVGKSRREQLEAKLEKASAPVKRAVLAAYDRASFSNDDEFTEYLAEIEQTVAEDVQAQADAGLGNDVPAKMLGGGKIDEKEVSPMMKSFLNEQAEAAKTKTA